MTTSISNSATIATDDLNKAISKCFSINKQIDSNRGKLQAALVAFGEAHAWDSGKLAVAFSEVPAMVKYAAMVIVKPAEDASEADHAQYTDALASKKQLDNILRGQLRGLDKKLDGVVLRLNKGSIAVLPAPKPVIEAEAATSVPADTAQGTQGTNDVVSLPALDSLLESGTPITAQGTNDAPDADDSAAPTTGGTVDTLPAFAGEHEGVQWLASLPFNQLQQVTNAASEQRLAAGAIGRIRAVQ